MGGVVTDNRRDAVPTSPRPDGTDRSMTRTAASDARLREAAWMALLYESRQRSDCWCGEPDPGHSGWLRCAWRAVENRVGVSSSGPKEGPPPGLDVGGRGIKGGPTDD